MAAVAQPVSVPTSIGSREAFDLAESVLCLQRIEDPQVSLHQCASRYGAETLRALFERLERTDSTSKFEEINLSDNDIGDDGAEWLMKGLTAKTKAGEQVGCTLKTLLMPRTRLGAPGIQAIGAIIGSSKSLENVVLSGNPCDGKCVEGKFCTSLSANKSLRSLCIAACRLGDAAATALAAGPLRSHPRLEHISLQYNRLGPAAAKSLAAMLEANQALRYLDISGNTIGPDGAVALADGVAKNKGRLQKLSVAQNEINLQGAKAFCKLFTSPAGQALTYLDLRHNSVPYAGVKQLRIELGKPMEEGDGWMMLFGERQLLLNR